MKIRRFLFLLAAVILSGTVSAQDTYRILHINRPPVIIDGKEFFKGDIFRDDAEIRWTDDMQAMKVMNVRDGRQFVIVSKEYGGLKSGSLSSYLLQSKRMSSRQGRALNMADLKLMLADRFYLMDSIRVESALPTDDDHVFFISYEYGGETINKLVPCRDGGFTVDWDIYSIDCRRIEPFETDVCVYYWDKIKEQCTLLTDRMRIVPVP